MFKLKPAAAPNSKVSASLKLTFFLSLNRNDAWGPKSKLIALFKLIFAKTGIEIYPNSFLNSSTAFL